MQQLQRGWACVTLEHENNAPFPKPSGPQTGGALGGKTSTAILPWFTVTASHTAPHYLYHVGGGGGGESKREEKKGEEERIDTIFQ